MGCGMGGGASDGTAGKGGPLKRPGQEVAPETTQEIPGITDTRLEGVVKSFNESRGYGFIACDDLMAQLGCDCFLHDRQLGEFGVGSTVTFAVFLNKEGK